MDATIRCRAVTTLAVLILLSTGGCGSRTSPAPERYVGTWEDAANRIRVGRNGLGEGRLFRGHDPRPFTWELGVDRITITFDGSRRPEIFEGRLDAAGNLVVSSARSSVRLGKVDTPEPPAPFGPDAPGPATDSDDAGEGEKGAVSEHDA